MSEVAQQTDEKELQPENGLNIELLESEHKDNHMVDAAYQTLTNPMLDMDFHCPILLNLL